MNFFARSRLIIFLLFFFVCTILVSCKKYLAEKPLKSLVVPHTLADLQALLNYDQVINVNGPIITELISDNYYVSSEDWAAKAVDLRNNYIWDPAGESLNSWNFSYQNPVYYANVVLDQLPNIHYDQKDQPVYNTIKGSALFYRSFAFQRLSELFCLPYSSTANTDLGIVLRLSSSVEEKSVRSTVQQTYDQIINDLKAAIELLPVSADFPTHPGKAAAYGVLARTYLSMRDYTNARLYADLCLQQYNTLMDYNELDPAGFPPINGFNSETIFYNDAAYTGFLSNNVAKIDSSLYESYEDNDLRKTVFFTPNGPGTFGFQGSYDGTTSPDQPFDGIATDEMYLIRAESAAFLGDKTAALQDLNTLLEKRYLAGTFSPVTAVDAAEARAKILLERRKELLYRCLRWSDIRRLNLEGAGITMTRMINGVVYTLPPNDARSVLLIPQAVIKLTGIAQNPR